MTSSLEKLTKESQQQAKADRHQEAYRTFKERLLSKYVADLVD
jgi:hypothetical protein